MNNSASSNATHPRRLFLLDAVGACMSAFLLGWVLPVFQTHIGLPHYLLHLLALGAFLLAIFSGSCFLFAAQSRFRLMRMLAVFNGLYLCLSLVVVLLHTGQMKPLGYLYFAGETMLVLFLIRKEWRAAKQTRPLL